MTSRSREGEMAIYYFAIQFGQQELYKYAWRHTIPLFNVYVMTSQIFRIAIILIHQWRQRKVVANDTNKRRTRTDERENRRKQKIGKTRISEICSTKITQPPFQIRPFFSFGFRFYFFILWAEIEKIKKAQKITKNKTAFSNTK